MSFFVFFGKIYVNIDVHDKFMSADNRSRLSTEQKTGFVLLLIFGVMAVGLGFFQLRNTIYGPFFIKAAGEQAASRPVDEQVRLQMIDTDQDGLNDYEELTFYQTSRYLPDTDSDGIDDKTEVDNGSDPLCPEGEDCAGEEIVAPTSTDGVVSPLAEETKTPIDVISQSDFGSVGTEDLDFEAILNDPSELRRLIKATGQVPDEVLDNIDDQTLMRMARESLAAQNTILNEQSSDRQEQ